MKKKIFAALCILGIPFFCLGINLILRRNHIQEHGVEKAATQVIETPNPQKEIDPKVTLPPERVIPAAPISKLNGDEGTVSYRWGDDCIAVDDSTVLLSCDCYFPQEELQQKIFYLAEAPDFVPYEVFRQNSRSGPSDALLNHPDILERRIFCPIRVQAGYVYESEGILYCLSGDFQNTDFLCDIRSLMGELYHFSPWMEDQNKCDVTADASKILACTDQGLYEYNLSSTEKELLEPAAFLPYEIVHIEGDCDCGETGFEFSGPIRAEYAPNDQGYAFLTGTEYGDPEGVTLRSSNGETLYQKEFPDYTGDFEWLVSEDGVFLTVFYHESENTRMDRINIETGEKRSYAVPDAVFTQAGLCVGFPDTDSLIYCTKPVSSYQEKNNEQKSEYAIYQLQTAAQENMEFIEGNLPDWKVIVLNPGSYRAVILKYPVLQTTS